MGDEKGAREYSFKDIDCDGKMSDRAKREFMVFLGKMHVHFQFREITADCLHPKRF